MVYNRNAQKNPKEVIGIMNSMKMRYASVKDSKISTNGSNDHEINMRYDEPREGVCPSMTTRKDQEIDRVMRKICKTSDELKDGGMPQSKIVTNIRHRMSPYKTL